MDNENCEDCERYERGLCGRCYLDKISCNCENSEEECRKCYFR